jgi:hypothetical protein
VLTEFAVLCTNFEDVPTQTPLSYRAFRRPLGATDSARDFPLTLSATASPLVRFRLLDSTQVVVQIADSLGAVSEYVIGEQYTLTRSDRTPAQLLAQLELELYGNAGNGVPSTSDADRLANAADLIAQILKQAGVAGTKKRQISMADATASRDKIVETLAGTLEVEQTADTVTTRVRLLSAVVASGKISSKSRTTIVAFLTEKALPVIRSGAMPSSDVKSVVELIGAVVATASDTDLAVESFGQGVRDILSALSVSELANMVAFEYARKYTYHSVSAPASGEGDDERRFELELILEKRTADAPLPKLSLEATELLSAARAERGGGAARRVVARRRLRGLVGARADLLLGGRLAPRAVRVCCERSDGLRQPPARRSRSTPRRSAARWSSLTLRSTRRAPRSCRRRWRATAPTACACSSTARRSRRAAASR